MRKFLLFCALIGISITQSCQRSAQPQMPLTGLSSSPLETSTATLQGEQHMEYIVPLDEDSSTTCPFVVLRGKIFQHTFPGVPNYESIEDGDYPETRWVLEIPKSEIQRIREAKILPEKYFSDTDEIWWIQLIPPKTESDPIPFVGKTIVAEGYLGMLCFHVHTPITIETERIYNDE